ncbi:hypothetical protein EVAR_28154_1 [Eumeta japonica]|uniref:Mos1 transposase HTH domain-containing protein n=1 Tax=Eumeta variegata TaxID=151549 RepID=A0A4C1VDV8_EUMVA|nr:hypothetical protein EVAR_28154_1 [Eumeta japonica]
MIHYNFRRGLTQKQCIDHLRLTFGDKVPSETTVYHWFSEFNRGQSMLTDEFKEGRPKSNVIPQNIDAVQGLIVEDRHLSGSSFISRDKGVPGHKNKERI